MQFSIHPSIAMSLLAPALRMSPDLACPSPLQALKALQDMSSTAPPAPLQPSIRKAKTIPVQAFEVHGGVGWGLLGQRAIGGEGDVSCQRSLQQPPTS